MAQHPKSVAERERSGEYFEAKTHMNLSTLLAIDPKVRQVYIKEEYNSFTAQDLCRIRKAMIEGKYKLRSFKLVLSRVNWLAFLKECFGITVEETEENCIPRKMFRATNENVEIYIKDGVGPIFNLYHFDGNIKTSFFTYVPHTFAIMFEIEGGGKPYSTYKKVMMNHLY